MINLGGGGRAVKIPFSGATYKEIDMCVRKAVEVNENLKYVLRSLDYSNRVLEKDAMRTDDKYPYYLYDDIIFNDVNYFFNKDIFFGDTLQVLDTYSAAALEERHTDFDDYANWGLWEGVYEYGKNAVLTSFQRRNRNAEDVVLSSEEKMKLLENIRQNVTEVAKDNPEITFYYYFPPYSICWWDNDICRTGKLDWWLETEKITIEELLKYDNIKLFSFSDNLALITDLDNYRDRMHHSQEVNSMILQWIFEGNYQLTKENYGLYLERLEKNFREYDYESIYK